MRETTGEKRVIEDGRETSTYSVNCDCPEARNLRAKRKMAEQLIAMGLSEESTARILHFHLKDVTF